MGCSSYTINKFTCPGVQISGVNVKIGYNVFSSQLIRFAGFRSVKDDFVVRAQKMYSIMLERVDCAQRLIRSRDNVFGCHCNLLFKFGWFSWKQVPVALEVV